MDDEFQLRKQDELDLMPAQISAYRWMRTRQEIEVLQSRVFELELALAKQKRCIEELSEVKWRMEGLEK